MLQIPFSFDPKTVEKIKRSLFLTLGGIALVVGPVFGNEMLDFITKSDPIDWRIMAAMSLTAVGSFAINTIKEWMAGIKQSELNG